MNLATAIASTVVTSTVVAATVFSDQARVTRQGKLRLEAGVQRIEFAELPLSIIGDSVRVSARSEISATILGVETRQIHFNRTPAERLRELEDKLQHLQDEDATDADRTENWKKQLEHLNGLSEASPIFARGLARGKLTVESQSGLLKFLDGNRSGCQSQLRAIEIGRRDRTREIERLRSELQQLQAVKSTARFRVLVDLRLEEPGEVEIDLMYLIRDCQWKPLYDIRFRNDSIAVSYLAEVQQKTGEDWIGISLTLSTARPSAAQRIPKLMPWDLYEHSPPAMQPRGRAMAVGAGQELMATMAAPMGAVEDTSRMRAKVLRVAAPEVAIVEATDATVNFQIPTAVDVPSDGSPHKSTIGIFDLKPTVDHVTVPKLADSVFRRAKPSNTSPFTLLPGKAQLFIDDNFFGGTELPLVAPNEQFELFLGVDDRIRLERRQTKRDIGKSILGGRKRIQFGYHIKLKNHTNEAQKITVVDQIPRPQHEDIKVAIDSIDPKPYRQDDLNAIVWKLTLDPGAERKIIYEFTVDHPREMNVEGL